jgi:predicted ATP-grasp superfamily ATP-dependent carboligase
MELHFNELMKRNQKSLEGKKIAVVGFNARPIACSAIKTGAQVFVSDYWGDEDLLTCVTRCVSVLDPKPGNRQRQTLESPVHVSLIDNLLILLDDIEPDYILIGSGFDDHITSLARLEKKWRITGNSTKQMKSARNISILKRMADEFNVNFPSRKLAESADAALMIANKIGYPCVFRPVRTGGGSGITLVSDPKDVSETYRLLGPVRGCDDIMIEPLIQGLDVSCSVLSSEDQSFALSVQGQLIGMPSAGRNCDFVYCGNYLPVSLDLQVREKIESVSENLCTSLNLLGSNGIDFIVDMNNKIWLMEINPRIQGTLEMLENASNVSITMLHIDATKGTLPEKKSLFKPCVKLVVFSRWDGRVPLLSNYNAVDRSPTGVTVQIGDPVCTLIESGKSVIECYNGTRMIADSIQRSIKSF